MDSVWTYLLCLYPSPTRVEDYGNNATIDTTILTRFATRHCTLP